METTLDTAVHCAVVYGGTSGGCTVVFWVRSKTPYKPTVQNPTVHGNYHRTMYGGCASAQTVSWSVASQGNIRSVDSKYFSLCDHGILILFAKEEGLKKKHVQISKRS